MRDVLDLTVLDVESVTVRSVAGHGDQAELVVQTRRGTLTLRLLGRRDRSIRLTDLRARDKRRRRRGHPLVSVPMPSATAGGGRSIRPGPGAPSAYALVERRPTRRVI